MIPGTNGLLRPGLLAAVLVLLAACSDNPDPGQNGTAGPDDQVLNVYNWTDYIGSNTIADFEARTGIQVTYDTYDSNELLETKLLTGHSGYDVVFPTTTIVGRMAKVGVFRRLDKARLPNLSKLDPEAMRQLAANDPGNEHAIAYTWGTTGLGYNRAKVKEALGTDAIDSWSAVFDPATASKLAKCGITLLDAPEDVFESAEIYLGTDPGNEDLGEMAAVEELLKKVRPYVRSFDTTRHPSALASGEICVSLSWSGLMHQARARGAAATTPVQLAYVIPREGAPLYFDTVAIPADAPHPDNAHAFLNFLMEPRVIAEITNEIGYANANAVSLPFVDAVFRDDPSIYPPPELREKLHVSTARSQDYSRELNRAWTRIKTGQ
ncbi:MAG: polyamine ABC transporter substrate-binding protein [Steroidobacteraceae bacterium]